VFKAGVAGVFRRLGDMLSVRNGSGCAEKWTSVSPCRVQEDHVERRRDSEASHQRHNIATQVEFETSS